MTQRAPLTRVRGAAEARPLEPLTLRERGFPRTDSRRTEARPLPQAPEADAPEAPEIPLRRTGIFPAVLRAVLCIALLLVSFSGIAHAAAMSFPALTGRVVDDANILSDDTKNQLTQLLAQEEKQTTNQIVVVTLKSLGGYPIEDYGYQLGRHWGIGQKKKDNGALIIVVPSDHKVRIEVGYGLEGQLTDAQTEVVIQRYMRPAFRRGDYDAGVLAGTQAVLQLLGGVTLTPPPQYADNGQDQQDSHGGFPWGFIVLILVWLVFGRFLWPLLFLGGFGGGGRGGWGGGGFGGGGFGGSGGGGFSGGGGGFGGGGASGSW
jgi:uncharacterized protein